jgi:hypothetical protein
MRRGKIARELAVKGPATTIVQRALTAGATSLRPNYWLPGLAQFDEANMRLLCNEIATRVKSAEDQNALIVRTKMAVDDFLAAKRIENDEAKAREAAKSMGVAIANKKPSVRNTIETLEAFSQSLRTVAELWRTVGPMMHGRLRAFDSPRSSERPMQAERIRRVLSEDMWSLLAAIDETTKQLETAKSIRLLDEYRCVMRIAMAWKQYTGERPTVTRNTDAVSGPQATPFERFISAAVPLPISKKVIRNVVEAARDGKPHTKR